MTRLAGSRDAGEDVVQEAYMRAWKYKGSYNPNKAKLNTWFNTILYNSLRDYKKLDKLGGVVVDNKTDEIEEHVPYEKVQEHLLLVWGEINEMKGHKRIKRILYLFYILGYTSKEISEIEENVTQSNVTTISNRFKKLVADRHGVEV
jgi:RNA polymerase sigma factor (sigma-70 family)